MALTMRQVYEQNTTKTQVAIDFFKQNKLKEAFQIVKDFRMGITKEEKNILSRGYGCIQNPSFYQELGMDIKNEIEKAVEVFKKLFVQEQSN